MSTTLVIFIKEDRSDSKLIHKLRIDAVPNGNIGMFGDVCTVNRVTEIWAATPGKSLLEDAATIVESSTKQACSTVMLDEASEAPLPPLKRVVVVFV